MLNLSDLTELQPPAGEQIYSIGHCCTHLQILPADLCAVMRSCGVRFHTSINGVGHLSGEDLQKIADALREGRE